MRANFDQPLAYEAWYRRPKGRLVDRLEKQVIADLCRVKPGERILEIGCGTGHFTEYFASLGAEVVGLDTSAEMLSLARDRSGRFKIDLKQGEAYQLPFADKSFDLVAMVTTLEFMAEPKRAIEEAFRVSRGRLFFGILNRHSLLAWRRKRSGKEIWQQARFYVLNEVKKMLGRSVKINWRGTIFLPLFDTYFAFAQRLWLERSLSRLALPFGAFIGIMAEEPLK
ncbi:MAG: methyltransferase domain-containing protein [Candidatus Saganbacteria bacterium]|nr:methyltransferase domain-containing protein [Candidatus Saganbacteria bacterium]